MKKVAVFDVDGTIFRSSLLIELVETMISSGALPQGIRGLYEKEQILWLDRKGDYQNYIDAVVDVFMNNLKGMHYGKFKDAVDETINKHKNRTYRYTRDLIKELKKKKYYLLAISASPKGILDSFCEHLGFDKVYGKIYELGPNDCFTGKIIDGHLIMNKAMVLQRAVKKEGLTLNDSFGVGDTEGDIPFLEMVQNPICFNPNGKLFKAAKRNGWKVVVERKDVVYEI